MGAEDGMIENRMTENNGLAEEVTFPVLPHDITLLTIKKSSDRISISGSVTLKRGEKIRGGGKTKRSLLERKSKFDSSEKPDTRLSNSISGWLLNVPIGDMELWPGVKLSFDTKMLDAKVENGNIDLSIAKISGSISGELDAQTLSIHPFGKILLEHENIRYFLDKQVRLKISIKFEVTVDPADAARLARMAKNARSQAKNLAEAVRADRKHAALAEENRKIRDSLKKRGSKMNPTKRRVLTQRLERNKQKITQIRKKISENKRATQRLARGYLSDKRKLASKAGKTVGKLIGKAGKKILAKLIPGVNIISTAIDIIDISKGIWALLNGDAKFGSSGGGGGGDGDEGGTSNTNDNNDNKSNGTSETGSAGKSNGTSEDISGENNDTNGDRAAGNSHGAHKDRSGDGMVERDDFDLGPEISIDEELAFEPASALEKAQIPNTKGQNPAKDEKENVESISKDLENDIQQDRAGKLFELRPLLNEGMGYLVVVNYLNNGGNRQPLEAFLNQIELKELHDQKFSFILTLTINKIPRQGQLKTLREELENAYPGKEQTSVGFKGTVSIFKAGFSIDSYEEYDMANYTVQFRFFNPDYINFKLDSYRQLKVPRKLLLTKINVSPLTIKAKRK